MFSTLYYLDIIAFSIGVFEVDGSGTKRLCNLRNCKAVYNLVVCKFTTAGKRKTFYATS